MAGIYDSAKREVGYNATRFLQLLSELGGLGAARRLLQSSAPSYGLSALALAGRLDLSVESQVVKPEFQTLFTVAEVSTANQRLTDYGFGPRG